MVYFETVARLGSIRKSAAALNVVPSAISRSLGKLERELRTPLFDRTPKGLRLTSAGELLLYHARGGAELMERGRSAIDDLRGLKKGHVGLAAMEGVATGPVVGLLARFWKKYPQISVAVRIAGSMAALEAVRSGELDLALAFETPEVPRVRRLGSATLSVAAFMRPEHPLAKAKRIRLRDLAPYPVMIADTSLNLGVKLARAFQRAGLDIQPRLETNSMALMHRLAAEGLGLILKPPVGVEGELASGQLCQVALDEPSIAAERLSLFARGQMPLSPAAGALAAELIQLLRELDDDRRSGA